jgi:hypothetical protein
VPPLSRAAVEGGPSSGSAVIDRRVAALSPPGCGESSARSRVFAYSNGCCRRAGARTPRSTLLSSMWTKRGGRHEDGDAGASGACTRRAIGSCRANPPRKAARVSPESGTHGRKSRGIVSLCARFAALTRISFRIVARHCATHPCKQLKIQGKVWRREWDSNSRGSFRFFNLQTPRCRECQRCRGCRRPLHAIARQRLQAGSPDAPDTVLVEHLIVVDDADLLALRPAMTIRSNGSRWSAASPPAVVRAGP